MEKIFLGTTSKQTFNVISKYHQKVFGVCLNMFNFDSNLSKKFELLEKLNLNIFMDNGSFERFTQFLKNEILANEYFSYENSELFFDSITKNYQILLKESKNSQKVIITIPEVIGSSELTQKLQEKNIQKYLEIEKEYNIKIIIALQFNPNSENWKEELRTGANFIKNNIPKTWIIGIPFGNDFKILSKKNNFSEIEHIFRTILKGFKAHLFACGSIGKIEKFVLKNTDFIYSIDASSIMNIAKYSHYLSTSSRKVLDIRALHGRTCSKEIQINKINELEEDSGISFEEWVELNYIKRFDIIFKNFVSILIFFHI